MSKININEEYISQLIKYIDSSIEKAKSNYIKYKNVSIPSDFSNFELRRELELDYKEDYDNLIEIKSKISNLKNKLSQISSDELLIINSIEDFELSTIDLDDVDLNDNILYKGLVENQEGNNANISLENNSERTSISNNTFDSGENDIRINDLISDTSEISDQTIVSLRSGDIRIGESQNGVVVENPEIASDNNNVNITNRQTGSIMQNINETNMAEKVSLKSSTNDKVFKDFNYDLESNNVGLDDKLSTPVFKDTDVVTNSANIKTESSETSIPIHDYEFNIDNSGIGMKSDTSSVSVTEKDINLENGNISIDDIIE